MATTTQLNTANSNHNDPIILTLDPTTNALNLKYLRISSLDPTDFAELGNVNPAGSSPTHPATHELKVGKVAFTKLASAGANPQIEIDYDINFVVSEFNTLP